MITSARVFEFVEKLKAVVANSYCEMSKCGIFSRNSCESPGCHAGWAYLAIVGDPEEPLGYFEGKLELSRFFGFSSPEHLKDWAYNNPKIWGNYNGQWMFCYGSAFGQSTNLFPAQVLVDHWQGVAERLKKKEVENELPQIS